MDARANALGTDYRVCFHPHTRRHPLLRIPDTLVAVVDGEAVRNAQQLDEIFRRLPEKPPREIRMAKTAGDLRGLEIHFLDRSALDAVLRSMQDLRVLELPPSWRCGAGADRGATIRIGMREFSNNLRCQDDETTRFRGFVGQLEAAASSAPPEHRTPPPSCAEVRTLATQFALHREGHDVELRYVDWMKSTGVSPDATLEKCPDLRATGSIRVAEVKGGQMGDVQKVVNDMWPDLVYCYASVIVRGFEHEGDFSLSFNIGPTGETRAVTISQFKPLPDSVLACVRARALKARFSAPYGGPSTVRTWVSFQK